MSQLPTPTLVPKSPYWGGATRQLRQLYRRCRAQDSEKQTNAVKAWQAAFSEAREIYQTRLAALPKPSLVEGLPVSEHATKILSLIQAHQVVIVAGDTGSGKTTQLGKICFQAGLGAKGYIGHTQPRRIAAVSVAKRIAQEMGTTIGEQVGFQTRQHKQWRASGYLKVMTDGILLNEIQSDPFLNQYEVLIIDEAHERSLNIDLILGLLKNILPKRPDLKLIITSATIDVQRFSEFFNQAPVIEVPGRMFPVETHYDPLPPQGNLYQHITQVLKKIQQSRTDGDVLVFMTGEHDIHQAMRFVYQSGLNDLALYPLYARLSTQAQEKIFQKGDGRRKVIFATNVAETSLTVPNIRYVIDVGMARISRYNPHSKIQGLPIEPISKASADQRKGRCGRIGPGVCYRLYDADAFATRDAQTQPEIQRAHLASVILQMKGLRIHDIAAFPFIDAPDLKQVKEGLLLLTHIGALDPQTANITHLGKQLLRFPIGPVEARMLVAASELDCLSEVLPIVTALQVQDPVIRVTKDSHADQAQQSWVHPKSDFMSKLQLWQQFAKAHQTHKRGQLFDWCRERGLNGLRMLEWWDLNTQVKKICLDLGLFLNESASEYPQIHQALLTGFCYGVARKKDKHYQGARDVNFTLSPQSALSGKGEWIMVGSLVRTHKVQARMAAHIEPAWVVSALPQLITRSHYDPYFDAKTGFVQAYEKATLFGVLLYQQKPVNYGTIDAEHAHRLFIVEGLSEGHAAPHFTWLTDNLAILAEIEAMATRQDRLELVPTLASLVERYEAVVPSHIHHVAALRRYLTKHPEKKALLVFTRETFESAFAKEDTTRFPHSIEVKGQSFKAIYQSQPNLPRIVFEVPDALTSFYEEEDFAYLVPGLLEAKLLECIRLLPKAVRKQVQPAKQFAKALAESMESKTPFMQSFAKALSKMTGLPMRVFDIDLKALPVAYQPGFSDSVATDAVNWRLTLANTTQHSKIVSKPAPDSVFSAEYDKLPLPAMPREKKISIEQHTVEGYLWLFETEHAVKLSYTHQERQAVFDAPMAIAKLCALTEGPLLKRAKALPEASFLAKQAKTLRYEGSEPLLVRLWIMSWRHALAAKGLNEQNAWQVLSDPTKLDSYFKAAQPLVSSIALNHAKWLKDICLGCQRLSQLLNRAKTCKHWSNRIDNNIAAQLDWLFHPKWLEMVSQEDVKRYPVYLKATVTELEWLLSDPSKLRKRHPELYAVTEPFTRLAPSDPYRFEWPSWYAYSWMVEEYRVSIFCPNIKTRFPVSLKRLQKEWQTLSLVKPK